MGTLNIMDIAQVANHEGNVVDIALFLRIGIFVLLFTIIGLVFIVDLLFGSKNAGEKVVKEGEYGYSVSKDSALLVAAWAVVTLMLTFNDKIFYLFPGHKFLIFPNFMDRYLTFFAQICIIIAAFGMYYLLRALDLDVLKEKP